MKMMKTVFIWLIIGQLLNQNTTLKKKFIQQLIQETKHLKASNAEPF